MLLARIGRKRAGVIRNAVQTISKSSVMIFEWVANLLLVPIIAFYLLRDWDHIVAYIDDLLPRSIQPTCAQIASEADGVLGAFLRGRINRYVSVKHTICRRLIYCRG